MAGESQNSEKVYGLKDPVWYAPYNVVYHYGKHLDSLSADQKTTKAFKKADELMVAAIALVGIQLDAGGEPFWMQPVSDSEGSPDVRTGHWLPPVGTHAPFFEMQDVEVVGFMPKPGEDLASFLSRTKLSKDKAYDARTTILCHMQTGAHIPSLPAITADLQSTGAVCPVIVLGRTHPEHKDYTLFQVHPRFKNIADYNVIDALNAENRSGVLNLRLGSKPSNESRPEEKHCPFESLGFECPLIDA